jgi:competence protein ComEA
MPNLPLSRRQVLVLAAAALVLLVLAGRVLLHSGGATSDAPAPQPLPAPGASLPTAQVVVDVVGAVRRPGLYRMHQGDRIADAVARAGGATHKAALSLINLAAPLADGEQVVVPQRGAASAAAGVGAGASGGAAAGTPTGPVHLNTATLEQLDSLPGIGPVTAQKILDYRQKHGAFSSVDELDAVPGIGPSRLDQLRDLVAP